MQRRVLLPLALALALIGKGQYCFTVVQGARLTVVPGCKVYCMDGAGPWLADKAGRVCVNTTCDSLRIEASGFEPRVVSATVTNTGLLRLIPSVQDLHEVVVEPWPRKQDRHALTSVATVDSLLLSGGERSSLRGAVQWVPGVQWDERGHGGSMRLSIRGSLLRSPYGVRGVKVYWGPFPLTLADGSTPLEVLDPITTGSVDVVRSVGSPVYGSAPSGMLLANAPFRASPGMDAMIEGTGGSFGYYRLGVQARATDAKSALTAGLVHQHNDGYRAQEWSGRDQAFITSRFTSAKSTMQVFLTWQSASWALPGSLNEQTAKDDPRAARPYSEAINAHIDKQQLMGGVATELRLSEHLHIRSGLDAQVIDKKNPYGTSAAACGYKDEHIRSAGARLALGGDQPLLGLPFAWEIGMEGLLERDRLKENSYVNAEIGGLTVDADTRVMNLNAFAMTTTRFGRGTFLHMGLGLERTFFDHQDLLATREGELETTPVLLPHVALEHRVKDGVKLRLRYAESVSRPTVWELLGTAGQFNTELHGETVREVEFGVATDLRSTEDGVEGAVFSRRVDGLIVQQNTPDGADQYYENAKHATITGAELRVHGSPLGAVPGRTVVSCNIAAFITNVTMPSTDGSENFEGDIPGVPAVSFGFLLRETILKNRRLVVEAGLRFSSPVDCAFSSDATMPSYHVEQMGLSYDLPGNGCRFGFFLNCENLLDAQYSSWVQVNDPGGRYYNPAPGRSFFGGVRLTFDSGTGREGD